VAATNRDLEKMVANREFRSDLYYRLHVFPIRIPPLRNRREDIPVLVGYFVQKFAQEMQKRIEAVPASVMKGLTAWDWPGNIRELENFIERAVLLTRGKSLEAPLAEFRKANAEASTCMKPGKWLEKEQIREATKAALLTNMQESSVTRSYAHLRHAKDAWVVPMVLPRAWE
jgi:formate hydrogenlyase transcriptional activator